MQLVILVTFMMSAIGLWSCGASVNVPPVAMEEIPAIEAAGNYPHRKYVIEPEDTLQIRYTYHADMNQRVSVRPDGKITVSLIGEVDVAGLTTAEVEKILTERSQEQLRNPEVIVAIDKFAEKNVYVGGEVRKPGMIPYRKGLTPLQAIIAAGGFLNTARADSVVLVRTGGKENQYVSRKLNLTEAIADGVKEPLYLAPHDVIYIPKTPIAEANLWVEQHITDLLPFMKSTAGFSYRLQ